MKEAIRALNFLFKHENLVEIKACCCGHTKYQMTIVYQILSTNKIVELFSGIEIPRKRRFYKRDKEQFELIKVVKELLEEETGIKYNENINEKIDNEKNLVSH